MFIFLFANVDDDIGVAGIFAAGGLHLLLPQNMMPFSHRPIQATLLQNYFHLPPPNIGVARILSGGALFPKKKLTTFFSRRPQNSVLNIPPI